MIYTIKYKINGQTASFDVAHSYLYQTKRGLQQFACRQLYKRGLARVAEAPAGFDISWRES